MAVLLIDLKVCHLEEGSENQFYSGNVFIGTHGIVSVSCKSHDSLTLWRKHLPTSSGQSVYCSNSLRKVLEKMVQNKRKEEEEHLMTEATSEANNMTCHSVAIINDRQVALLHLLWKW